MLNLLPWQGAQWEKIVQIRLDNRLPHALLFSGPQGIGKAQFARFFASSLFCFSPSKDYVPCGKCKTCELFVAGNHPDIRLIEPEEEGKQIKVDQIRELIDFINLKSQYERYKIAIINPADAMNRSAANTLLKTLEEPPEQSILILLSHRPNLLPVTIRSRCQQIQFNPVYDESTKNWLNENLDNQQSAEQLLIMSSGAPLTAIAMVENDEIEKILMVINDLELVQEHKDDPIHVAEKWNKTGATRIFQWLLQLMGDLVRLKSSSGHVRHYQSDIYPRLQRLTNRLDLYRLMQCHDLLLKNYSMCMGQISYNTQALLEDFIIYWQEQANHTGG